MNKDVFNKLPAEMQDSYTRLCMDVNLNIDLDSVILSEHNRGVIQEFITETEYKMKFVEYGLEPVNRLIFYGASGTGKTYLTKALANYFGYEMLYIHIANALSLGNAAQALEDIFKLGNHLGKAIIFLDECDAVCRRRDGGIQEEPDVRRAINTLFQLLDQLNPECIFVSATNLYKSLDPAFVRRFNVKLQFDRPKLTDIDSTIEKFVLPKFTIKWDMDLKQKEIILDQAKGYTALSYYEIQDWVQRAEKKAIIEGKTEIRESTIYQYFMDTTHLCVLYHEDGTMYLYQKN